MPVFFGPLLALKSTRFALSVMSVLAFVAWFAADQRSKGAAKAVATIEKANTNAVKKADDVGSKSRSPSAGGVRDPYEITGQ